MYRGYMEDEGKSEFDFQIHRFNEEGRASSVKVISAYNY